MGRVKCLKCVLSHCSLKALRSPWFQELVACKVPTRALWTSGSTEVSAPGSGSPVMPWISRTFRMLSSSSRIKASVCVKSVEVMESCSQRPAETHVVHGSRQLKHKQSTLRFWCNRKSGSGPGAILTLNCLSVENPSSCSRTEM